MVVRDEVKERRIKIDQINYDAMIADPLTKGLPHRIFYEHVVKMGLLNSFNVFGWWGFLVLIFMFMNCNNP